MGFGTDSNSDCKDKLSLISMVQTRAQKTIMTRAVRLEPGTTFIQAGRITKIQYTVKPQQADGISFDTDGACPRQEAQVSGLLLNLKTYTACLTLVSGV